MPGPLEGIKVVSGPGRASADALFATKPLDDARFATGRPRARAASRTLPRRHFRD